MQLGVFLFVVSLLFSNSIASAEIPKASSFCVQTINVYGPAYASGVQWRLGMLSDMLERDPCEVVQFQEFWRESDFRFFKTEFQQSRMLLLQADAIRNDGNSIGLVSAFSGSILKAYSEVFRVNNEDGVLDWVRDLAGVQKGFTIIEAQVENAPRSLFVNVHTHPTSQAIRLAQLTQLVEFLYFRNHKAALLPLVLTGDLNSTPDSLEYDLLRNLLRVRDAFLGFHGTYEGVCTYCTDNSLSWSNKNHVIDYVFYRDSETENLEVENAVINLQGREEARLSDHYGVRANLQWSKQTGSLLPDDSTEVQARIRAALKTVHDVRNVFLREDSEVFSNAIQTLEALENVLLEKHPDSTAMKMLRLL